MRTPEVAGPLSRRIGVSIFAALVVAAAAAVPTATAATTTLDETIVGKSLPDPFSLLAPGMPTRVSYALTSPPRCPVVRAARSSLTYFGQLTDFQLADEESPARVEFTEQEPSGFAASAWRPQEALQPFIIDWSIRQMNLFAGASPVQQGDGGRAAMDFALITGDQADNMQRNEILWTRALLEGGTLDPNSGSQNPADWDALAHPSCAAYPPDRGPPRRGGQVHRRPGLRRLRRGAQPILLRPRPCPRASGRTGPSTPA